jgi:coenzyme F420-0:L-glutamate ligase/coenzyme F420-1:gamma-L-glutamate ligase
MNIGQIEIIPVKEMGFIEKGQDLTALILQRLEQQGVAVDENDVVVITSKVVSKAEGRIIPLSTVIPSRAARALAKVSGRDPRICELIIRHSKKVWGILPTGKAALDWYAKLPEVFPVGRKMVEELFAKEPTMILAEIYNGLVVTDAGIDCSNVHGTENAILLPENADRSCQQIREEIRQKTGKTVAVIMSDTDIRFQRFGSVDQTVGSWGIETVASHFGQKDLYGKPKVGGVDAVADMIANAAALIMGNTDQAIPVVLMKGVQYRASEKGLSPIQVPLDSVGQGVIYNLWCDLKLWVYNLAGA